MTKLKELPLFPLNTVLFPGMQLPLHIFEDRYRVMISQCIAQNQPFCVTLIQEGAEVGGSAIPHKVGTSAHIVHVEHLEQGRMNIQAMGHKRFRVHQLRHDLPYLVGLVEGFPVQRGTKATELAAMRELETQLQLYLGTLAEAVNVDLEIAQLPDDAMALAFLTAIVLQVPLEEKQNLLAIPGLQAIMQAERRLLTRELALLEYMFRKEIGQGNSLSSFSVN